jgi:hypothetical protein
VPAVTSATVAVAVAAVATAPPFPPRSPRWQRQPSPPYRRGVSCPAPRSFAKGPGSRPPSRSSTAGYHPPRQDAEKMRS